jgi:16S rRNA C1402 N4-methylase RsmH
MRMCADKNAGLKFDSLVNMSLTAEYVVNNFSEEDLANIIYTVSPKSSYIRSSFNLTSVFE